MRIGGPAGFACWTERHHLTKGFGAYGVRYLFVSLLNDWVHIATIRKFDPTDARIDQSNTITQSAAQTDR
jgi:hypothetical protein